MIKMSPIQMPSAQFVMLIAAARSVVCVIYKKVNDRGCSILSLALLIVEPCRN